jgi:hypothetical protein
MLVIEFKTDSILSVLILNGIMVFMLLLFINMIIILIVMFIEKLILEIKFINYLQSMTFIVMLIIILINYGQKCYYNKILI